MADAKCDWRVNFRGMCPGPQHIWSFGLCAPTVRSVISTLSVHRSAALQALSFYVIFNRQSLK
jgi:hypothetical protein